MGDSPVASRGRPKRSRTKYSSVPSRVLPSAIKSEPKSDSESSEDGERRSSRIKRPKLKSKSALKLDDGRGAAVNRSIRRRRKRPRSALVDECTTAKIAKRELGEKREERVEEKHEDLNVLFENKGLKCSKWTPLFRKEHIINHDDILAMGDVNARFETYKRLVLHASNDSERNSLQQIFNIMIPEEVPDSAISEKLAQAGLDPRYWSDKFCKKLGVTSFPALELVGGESYAELEPFCKFQWQKKALRKLLNMDEEENTLSTQRLKQKEKLEKREHEAKRFLKELESLRSEGRGRSDSEVQRMESRVREMWQIPPAMWISENKTLDEVISQLKQSHEAISGSLKSRQDVSDRELLKIASGGLALQGILYTNDLHDQLKQRACLLKVPSTVQLLGASHPQDDKIEHFTIKHQEKIFKKAVNILGYSASVSAKALGFWSIETGIAFNKKCEEEKDCEQNDQLLYLSTVKYSSMPLASYSFSDSDLYLTDDAIKDLKAIEQKMIIYSADSEQVQKASMNFFIKFGSHANRGPLHFGGIYWWTCSSTAVKFEQKSKIKEIQNQAVDMHGGICAFSVGLSANLDISSIKAQYEDKCSESTLAQTKLEVSKTGGPPEISSLPEWKTGLVVSNSTWSLIDRGTTLVPIWDIIEINHNKWIFQNPWDLSRQLSRTWSKMTESPQPDVMETSYSVAEVLDTLEKWSKSEDIQQVEEKLQYILRVKKDLIKVSLNPQVWSSLYLSKPAVQHFLKKVTRKEELSPDPSGYINLLLKEIVEKAELNSMKSIDFPDKDYIYDRLYYYCFESSIQPECDDFAVLCKSVQLSIEAMHATVALVQNDTFLSASAAITECSSRVTTSIAKAVSSLRTKLLKSGHKYDDLLITTVMYPFKHGTSYQPVILKRLTQDNLKYLHKELEEKSKEFLDLRSKDRSPIRIQAFLFKTAVDVRYSGHVHEVDVSETQVRKHIMYMERQIGSELQAQIKEVLALYSNDSRSWEKLQEKLTQLAMTNSSVLKQLKKRSGHSLDDVLQEVHVLKKITEVDEDDTLQIHTNDNSKVSNLMKILGLDHYYPKKLLLKDALCIREELLRTSNYTEPKQLPLVMLHNVMSYNNRWRKLHFSNIEEGSSSSESDQSLFSDEGGKSDVYHGAQVESVLQFHPMDVFLSLLHCADDFLRQDLLSRLATNQHAIPIVLPNPVTQELTLLIWAMRSIVKEWKCKDEIEYEYPIVSYEAPIVSFVRFHEQNTSKSKLLNSVISDCHYDHFFHRDCEGGTYKQLLGDGLIELCWYLPAGTVDDYFPNVIFFLNLHGDALKHPKQIQFLSKISLMSFVLLKAQDINDSDEYISVLDQLCHAPAGVVVLNESEKGLAHHVGNKLDKRICQLKGFKISKMNENDLKGEIRKRINKKIKSKWDGMQTERTKFEDCHSIALECGIATDEKSKEYIMGRKMADEMKQIICDHKNPDISAKELMLPLQDKQLWQQWATKDKELHRQIHRAAGVRIQNYTEHILMQRKRLRKLQLHQVQNLTPLMEIFIKTLLIQNTNVQNYFLHCLKLYLNDLTRKSFSCLQQKYCKKRLTFEETIQTKSAIETYRKEMEVIHEQLIDVSFGLEHFLRELGQIFEAIQYSPQKDDTRYSCLPRVAADLLIEGYALELMDGDAAHVPIKWVTAVLQEAISLLGDPKVFVLSILGIQSTGKSTLLNTAFGLQFKVSAGKCTRGAFMRLLEMDGRLRRKLNCDFVLVVDTEGLRAPEMDSLSLLNHDNELATFVIGLANVSVINIYGENPADMDDILQIAVHAFLRMKYVVLDPSCQFVHQNAGLLIKRKLELGRVGFKMKLDEKTCEAAKEENLEEQLNKFSDVIQFDDHKDVHYFPGLWDGALPMAAVKPEYSDRAHDLKVHLVDCMRSSKNSQLSSFKTKLTDLWKALLHEKFIFSFKNTSEAIVYKSLEDEYFGWEWMFQNKVMQWEHHAENQIKATKVTKHKELKKRLESELESQVASHYEKVHRKMEDYFETNEMRAEWRDTFQSRLQHHREKVKCRVIEQLDELISRQEAFQKLNEPRRRYRDELLKKAKDVAASLKGHNKSTQLELRNKFDDKWIEWMQELQSLDVQEFEIDVEMEVQKALLAFFRNYEGQVISKMQERKSLREWGGDLTINNKHICAPSVLRNRAQSFYARLSSRILLHAQTRANAMLNGARQYLVKLTRGGSTSRLEFYYSTQILLRHLTNEINTFHTSMYDFTQEYKIDMCLTVCGYATKHFEKVLDVHKKERNPFVYLQEMKESYYSFFRSMCLQITRETAAADTFCELLIKSIEREVVDSLGHMIVDNMSSVNPAFRSKRALKARILMDLAMNLQENAEFQDYICYLTDTRRSFENWINVYTQQHCDAQSIESNEKTTLAIFAIKELENLVEFVKLKVEHVTKQHPTNIREWFICFRRDQDLKCRLTLDVSSVLQDVYDLTVSKFTKEVCIKLEKKKNHLQDQFMMIKFEDVSWKNSPCDILFKQLQGCCEQCPFCKEQCDCSTKEHDIVKHTVQQHRPLYLGSQCESTPNAVYDIDICTSKVGSDATFQNGDTNQKPHPYKEYMKIYPEWSIPVDMSVEGSSYWKWFIGNYYKNLSVFFGTLEPETIPSYWKELKWEDIEKQLKQEYNV